MQKGRWRRLKLPLTWKLVVLTRCGSISSRAHRHSRSDLIRTKINLLPEGIQKVRVVEIAGLDLQADGGTHVNNTSEIGSIRVTDYKSKGKINKRLYIEVRPAG
jgi:misacylated tRNA(Ala) deacylase